MKSVLFWYRRDLRLDDNAGLAAALNASTSVYCVFVFDRDVMDELPTRHDRRVDFVWQSVLDLRAAIREAGGDLIIQYASAKKAIPKLAVELGVEAVFTNEDYEPAGMARDGFVKHELAQQGIQFRTFKDSVIFAKDEIITLMGRPYTLYSVYRQYWLKRVEPIDLKGYAYTRVYKNFVRERKVRNPNLIRGFEKLGVASMGFETTDVRDHVTPGISGAAAARDQFLARLDNYHQTRFRLIPNGSSQLSVHIRYGTLSVRELARLAYSRANGLEGDKHNPGADLWLSELIWRDFYTQILWNAPYAAKGPFRRVYENIPWQNDPAKFRAWCEGRTGFPIVDAAMRQLNQTGYMHNRMRVLTASFLVKDLLIDWRWGEQYFAEKLLDFDMAANNGGWQWAASTGSDAQPYFRIFNPYVQSLQFDPNGDFIRKYVRELSMLKTRHIHAPSLMPKSLADGLRYGFEMGRDYPYPIVEHDIQRVKAITLYHQVRATEGGANYADQAAAKLARLLAASEEGSGERERKARQKREQRARQGRREPSAKDAPPTSDAAEVDESGDDEDDIEDAE
jgi:deoxyribodipyrimidine photo-lyase